MAIGEDNGNALSELLLRRLREKDTANQAKRDQFSFGIEEEYFLHDKTTNRVAVRTPDALFRDANRATGGRRRR